MFKEERKVAPISESVSPSARVKEICENVRGREEGRRPSVRVWTHLREYKQFVRMFEEERKVGAHL